MNEGPHQAMPGEHFLELDQDQLGRLARALHQALPRHMTIVLSGTLGAGKTRFVQAFAEAAGVPPGEVTSPTFVLCQRYAADRTMHHVDAYRMRSGSEFIELGGLDLFEDEAIVFIEWGERIAEVLPENRLLLQFSIADDQRRNVQLSSNTRSLHTLVRRIREIFESLQD